MAHLALVIDADTDRRDRFAHGVRQLFAELPDTVGGEIHDGSLSCLWAAGPNAPIDISRDDDRLAVLIGYAVDEEGRWVTADELATAWLAAGGERHIHDGYHLGVAYDPGKGLVAGGDPLGLYPLYHASLPGGGVIVATTPQAFTCHPSWSWRIDRTGLAGILFAHGLLDDRPLLAGAKRVAAGYRLWMTGHEPPREIEVFRFEDASAAAGETFEAAVERIDAELMAAIRRHCPPGDGASLMLSGGTRHTSAPTRSSLAVAEASGGREPHSTPGRSRVRARSACRAGIDPWPLEFEVFDPHLSAGLARGRSMAS